MMLWAGLFWATIALINLALGILNVVRARRLDRFGASQLEWAKTNEHNARHNVRVAVALREVLRALHSGSAEDVMEAWDDLGEIVGAEMGPRSDA